MEIILGPPGTGKTTALLELVEQELDKGIPPDRIGFISFTRRAAEEARHRAQSKFRLGATELPWFRTIHSLCFAALGLSSSEVLEGKKLAEFGDAVGMNISSFISMDDGMSFGFTQGDRCLFMDNLARVKGISLREQYNQNTDDIPWNIVEQVSLNLAEYKKVKGLLDFTDMLQQFADSEWSARLDKLFVDEAQDLSMLQWRVVQRLAKGTSRVVIAGDDDQAIYQWAGAAVEHFVDLPGQVRVLGHSWRVPSAIQPLALEIISRVRHRREKKWEARAGDAGVVKRVGRLDYLDFNTGEDLLILSRNACFLRDDVMPLLKSDGILYEFRGATSVRQSLVEAIIDWEKLRKGEEITVAEAERVYSNMRAGEGYARGHKKLPNYKDREQMVNMPDLKIAGGLLTDVIWHDAFDRIPPSDRAYMTKALRRGERLTRRPTVRLSTIHGAKGGQAEHVILLTDMAARTVRECGPSGDPRTSPEEARCWYVAATRAKRQLSIVMPHDQRRQYEI